MEQEPQPDAEQGRGSLIPNKQATTISSPRRATYFERRAIRVLAAEQVGMEPTCTDIAKAILSGANQPPSYILSQLDKEATFIQAEYSKGDVAFRAALASATKALMADFLLTGMTAKVSTGLLARTWCEKYLPLRVLQSARGWYLGTADDEGPVSRESVEYWPTEDLAQIALEGEEGRDWTQRDHPRSNRKNHPPEPLLQRLFSIPVQEPNNLKGHTRETRDPAQRQPAPVP